MATSCWNELWMICALVATVTAAVVSGDADVTAPDVDVVATDVPSTGLPNAVTAAPVLRKPDLVNNSILFC